MKLSVIKIYWCCVIGAIGSAFTGLFGGWSNDMVSLIIFMAMDYITGLIVAGVFKNSDKTESGTLNSQIGFKGLCKKGVMLLIVLISYRLDLLLNVDYIRTASVIALIVNELVSICENIGLMGLPLPRVIVRAIDVLKEEENKYGNN